MVDFVFNDEKHSNYDVYNREDFMNSNVKYFFLQISKKKLHSLTDTWRQHV